jgi:8-oxo-dGTP pyrophosphatase MutT (NUDIX family)
MSRQPHLYAATYALIFNDDGQVLLLQRANTGYYDEARDFPAGHVDDGETVLESIRHECLEEIGIKVDVSESDVCHVIHVVNDDKQYINFCIRIVRWT